MVDMGRSSRNSKTIAQKHTLCGRPGCTAVDPERSGRSSENSENARNRPKSKHRKEAFSQAHSAVGLLLCPTVNTNSLLRTLQTCSPLYNIASQRKVHHAKVRRTTKYFCRIGARSHTAVACGAFGTFHLALSSCLSVLPPPRLQVVQLETRRVRLIFANDIWCASLSMLSQHTKFRALLLLAASQFAGAEDPNPIYSSSTNQRRRWQQPILHRPGLSRQSDATRCPASNHIRARHGALQECESKALPTTYSSRLTPGTHSSRRNILFADTGRGWTTYQST